MNQNHRTNQQVIEAIIDKESLEIVAAYLVAICQDKAEHLTCAWQDPASAKRWLQMANRFEKIEKDAEVRGL